MIFQAQIGSFSPVHTIGNQLAEVMRLHMDLDMKQTRARATAMLGKVGIVNPEHTKNLYPFGFSGGMIARSRRTR